LRKRRHRKSRLIEEFKEALDLDEIQWLEGHAYAYSQNIPYFPLIDLLNRIFSIEENDSPKNIRQKIKFGVENLIGRNVDVLPYVGSLYSLSYSEVEDVSPEFWKARLQEAILAILAALAKKSPTVFFLEDLHWADPSFAELLRQACLKNRQPAIVLCVYRPNFNLFSSHQITDIGKLYHEIKLDDLSLSDAQDMLESLLKSTNIPSELKRHVQRKAEGNPFYLEELVNSLIESGYLVLDDGIWKVTKPINDADISYSIHGLISGRLDRLEEETKRILQEASVIGRAFLYKILKKITEIKERIDRELNILERLDLIRIRTIQPDLEYIFKHPVTQEVVYNGLLKKERRKIHERIGIIIEKLFEKRISELFEILAYHFSRGHSTLKAIDYLMKSGEKSLKRYSLEESNKYYKEGFELLKNKSNKSREENKLLIDVLINWAYVYLYRGDFRGLRDLLSPYEKIALSINDREIIGMYLAWLGYTLYNTEEIPEAYKILRKALKVGEENQNKKVIGFACTLLVWTCKELGDFEEAISFGKRAQDISKIFDRDRFLYSTSLAGIAHTYIYKAELNKVFEIGKKLITYGQSQNDIRSECWGQWLIGFDNLVKGDFLAAAECGDKAIRLSIEPIFLSMSKYLFARMYVLEGKFEKAEQELKNIAADSERLGYGELGLPVHLLLGVVLIAQGHMKQGLKIIRDINAYSIKNQRKTIYALSEYFLGKIYLQIAERSGQKSITSLAKNLVFLLKNVPLAGKKAEEHFKNALEVSTEIGAKGYIAMVCLDLGILYKANKRVEEARKCISEAIKIMEDCEAEGHLRQAKEIFKSLV
jgi:tetratricopeptide (TPR) repeat protein